MESSAQGRARSPEPSQAHAALAGLSALLVGVGFGRFGYPPLIPALIQAGWFDAPQAAYLGATNLTGYLLGAALAPRLALRFSGTRLIRAALVAGTVALFACAFPFGFGWYFLWRMLSGVAGAFLMILAGPKVLAFAPPGRRGRVGGILFMGVGLGIALSGTLVPWLVGFGLPQTWAAFGAASVLLSALAWKGIPSVGDAREGSGTDAARAVSRTGGARLTLPLLWFGLSYGGYAVGFVPHTVFWVDYIARGLGEGLAVGGGYWALFGLAAGCGPLLTGWCADHIGFRRAYRYSLLADAGFVALPLVSASSWALALSSLGVGGLAAAISSLALGRVSELVPMAQQRQVWGWITIAFSLLYAASGYGMSFLFAATESYAPLFGIGAAALVLAFVLDLGASWNRGQKS